VKIKYDDPTSATGGFTYKVCWDDQEYAFRRTGEIRIIQTLDQAKSTGQKVMQALGKIGYIATLDNQTGYQ
jgi:hypothetical protein